MIMMWKSLFKVLLKVEFTPDFHQKLLDPGHRRTS